MHSGHVNATAGSNTWAYALISDVCPERKRDRGSPGLRFATRNSLEGRFANAFEEFNLKPILLHPHHAIVIRLHGRYVTYVVTLKPEIVDLLGM